MINILITAGGTAEPIDSVRSISNTATGRLGSLIADRFASEENVKVFYVCARSALRPSSENITCIEIGSVEELKNAVTELMSEYSVDAVIHSMAVSDYRVRAVSTPQRAAELLKNESISENNIINAISSTDIREETAKISSRLENPLILLERTPKILPLFREMSPKAVIVGFKLLSGVSEEELFDTAYRLLLNNGCDYVLANDASRINGDKHEGHLIDRYKKIQDFETKQEIAKGIVKAVMREVQLKA